MPTEYAGILAIPLIVGLVEAAKRSGLDAKWAAPLALALGLAVSLGYVATRPAAPGDWFAAVLAGLALGLSASGLYSAGKKATGG